MLNTITHYRSITCARIGRDEWYPMFSETKLETNWHRQLTGKQGVMLSTANKLFYVIDIARMWSRKLIHLGYKVIEIHTSVSVIVTWKAHHSFALGLCWASHVIHEATVTLILVSISISSLDEQCMRTHSAYGVVRMNALLTRAKMSSIPHHRFYSTMVTLN